MIASVVLIGLAAMLHRDLNLHYSGLGDSGVVPTVELKDVTLRRTSSGDMWTFLVRSIKKADRTGDLNDVTGRRVGPDGSIWTLTSPNGEYDSSEDRLTLRYGTGVFEEDDERFDWTAPVILWGGRSSDRWSFPDGVVISGDRYSLTGKSAEASPSEGVVLQEGVMEWWQENGLGR